MDLTECNYESVASFKINANPTKWSKFVIGSSKRDIHVAMNAIRVITLIILESMEWIAYRNWEIWETQWLVITLFKEKIEKGFKMENF